MRLSQAVKSKKVSQKGIAKKINKTPQYVSNMMTGKSPITIEMLSCITTEYDISADWIIKGDERRKVFRREIDDPAKRNKPSYLFDRRKTT